MSRGQGKIFFQRILRGACGKSVRQKRDMDDDEEEEACICVLRVSLQFNGSNGILLVEAVCRCRSLTTCPNDSTEALDVDVADADTCEPGLLEVVYWDDAFLSMMKSYFRCVTLSSMETVICPCSEYFSQCLFPERNWTVNFFKAATLSEFADRDTVSHHSRL